MNGALNHKQLEILLESGPVLDSLSLPPGAQSALAHVQQRAGRDYASGGWRVAATGETFLGPTSQGAVTVEEAREALGNAYLNLEEGKRKLRGVMDAMGIIPSSPHHSVLERALDSVKGWFR